MRIVVIAKSFKYKRKKTQMSTILLRFERSYIGSIRKLILGKQMMGQCHFFKYFSGLEDYRRICRPAE